MTPFAAEPKSGAVVCFNCRFWCVDYRDVDDGVDARGQCRRHAPSPTKGGFEQEVLQHITLLTWRAATEAEREKYFNDWEEAVVSVASWWPVTLANDWCGEHKPKAAT